MNVKMMILIGLFSFGFVINMVAQDRTVTAFSTSYKLESSKNYGEAIAQIQTVYNEESYPMNLRLGWLYYLKGDYFISTTFYEKAMNLQPNSIEAMLGYVYPLSALSNWNEVVTVYDNVLKIAPQNTLVHYRLAYIYHYILVDNSKAVAHINRSSNLLPFDYDTNILKAKINVSLGNIDEAKGAAYRALQYNPLSEEAQELYGVVK